jgi:hypothetical protein
MYTCSVLISLILAIAASAQPCQWTHRAEREPPGLFISGSSMPAAKLQTIWDPDGAGPLAPVLVMTGTPLNRVPHPAENRTLKLWDGIRWTEMPSPSSDVNAAVVYNGDLLIAGASPHLPGWTSSLYRYDGEDWHFIAPPATSSIDVTMLVRGSELFIVHALPQQFPASRAVWRWDGQTWTVLQQVPDATTAAVIHDGELIVSTNSGRLYRWTGETWELLPMLWNAVWVSALASIDGRLYAGTVTGRVHRLDGSNWVEVGSQIPSFHTVYGITKYRGDLFASITVPAYGHILRLDGNEWVISAVRDPLISTPPAVLRSFMEYQGELFVAGAFGSLNMGTGAMVARYDGERWKPLGSGADDEIRFLTSFQGNPIAGGRMLALGGKQVRGIGVRIPGVGWTELGGGLSYGDHSRPWVNAAVEYQGRLYVGGWFSHAGNVWSPGVAAWDGAQWHAVGGPNGFVNALAVYGDDIIATGYFNALGHIARWDGVAWHPLGQGIGGSGLAVLADGHNLYAAFSNPDPGSGYDTGHIARWDGSAWTPVGDTFDRRVLTLDRHYGRILAGGEFSACGTTPIRGFAWLDGDRWQPVAHPFTYAAVRTVRPWRNQLLLGGAFVNGTENWTMVAAWDGEVWTGIAPQVVSDGRLLALVPDGDDLILGGTFTRFGTELASRTATLSCTPWCYANCDGSTTPPLLNMGDFICFIHGFTEASALPHAQQVNHYANCDNSTIAPVLNVDDFACFINHFAAGCR